MLNIRSGCCLHARNLRTRLEGASQPGTERRLSCGSSMCNCARGGIGETVPGVVWKYLRLDLCVTEERVAQYSRVTLRVWHPEVFWTLALASWAPFRL